MSLFVTMLCKRLVKMMGRKRGGGGRKREKISTLPSLPKNRHWIFVFNCSFPDSVPFFFQKSTTEKATDNGFEAVLF